MPLSDTRWKSITPSAYAWEQDALNFVREGLPDVDPWRAWSNFEFIAEDGTINEVDLLVLSPSGFFLIEIKSWPGMLRGDSMTWIVEHQGRTHTHDNPLFLTDRKAKKLASLLKGQKSAKDIRIPFIEPLVFLSHDAMRCHLHDAARTRVTVRDRENPSAVYPPGIIGALTSRQFDGASNAPRTVIDRPIAKTIALAMEQAGIREPNRMRRVGDYELKSLLFDAANGVYQDWHGEHVQSGEPRRIRIYTIPRTGSEEARQLARRAAEREYVILGALSHPSVPQVETPIEHELGKALLFRIRKNATRLDHLLAERSSQLSMDFKLALMREIAEGVKYAHEKKIYHRALSPQSVLVTDLEKTSPHIQILNWQASSREGNSSDTSRVTATRHIEDLVESAAMGYVAPEALSDPQAAGETLDIFSLGAVAYHIFSGKPPAMSSLELIEKVRGGSGLQISAALDGASQALQELVQRSTNADTLLRPESVAEWLKLLDAVEEEFTRPSDEDVNPLDARATHRLPGGFVVRRRLGKGSSATAFLVEKGGREVVLKLANGPEKNERLRGEAETLKNLSHPNIAQFFESVEMKGLAGFTMEYAGERDPKKNERDLDSSLADRIRKEGALQLELLERFGIDLLEAVRYLELKGVSHRDIKPENVGVGPGTRRERLHLILFDFSLGRAPLTEIHAGTPPYLDPFLIDRPRRTWDSHAERYAAAMTLYEMATGTIPKWDGNPAAMNSEVPIEEERFEASLRDRFTSFFQRAFRRDPTQRFDNADVMLTAWKDLFADVGKPALATITREGFDLKTAIYQATPQTALVEFGLSTRASNALERLSIGNVEQLLGYSTYRLHRLRGVGIKTRKDILDLIALLRERFPDFKRETEPEEKHTDDSTEPEVGSIDAIRQQLTGRTRKQETAEKRILNHFLALDRSNPFNSFAWKSQTDVARDYGVTRAYVSQEVVRARARWKKNASIRSVREELVALLNLSGGVLTVEEAARALLASRGSGEPEPTRSQYASAVVRAALETERAMNEPRFFDRRDGDTIVIARSAELADLSERLGREADKLAGEEPLVPPARVMERLRAIYAKRDLTLPDGVQPMTDSRLVRLAVEASMRSALSSKGEVYPKGMPAERALNLASGALYGAKTLKEREIQERVFSRYPDSVPLPQRPQLDKLLADLNLSLEWSDETTQYEYIRRDLETRMSPSSTSATLMPVEAFEADSPQRVDARLFEQRLEHSLRDGGFLVLMAKPKKIALAQKKLTDRFGVTARNVDAIVLGAMQETAKENGVNWDLVIRADGAPLQSSDRNYLGALVSRAKARIVAKMSEDRTPLFTWAGLLARYDRMDVIETLRDQAGTRNYPVHGAWLLIAADDQSTRPVIDGKPVPVITSSQWTRIPDAWLEGMSDHR